MAELYLTTPISLIRNLQFIPGLSPYCYLTDSPHGRAAVYHVNNRDGQAKVEDSHAFPPPQLGL